MIPKTHHAAQWTTQDSRPRPSGAPRKAQYASRSDRPARSGPVRQDKRFLEALLSRTTLAALIAIGLLSHTGLSQQPTKQQIKLYDHESGFLGDEYSKLQPDANKDWLIYFRTPDVLQHSNTFILEPAKVFLVPEAQARDIPQDQLDKLADYFTKAMTEQLTAGGYKLVTEPGPGVMKLEFAITNVKPNGNRKNMAATATTDIALYGTTPPGTTMLIPRLTVGSVSIEGEMQDSQSGEVEMAFMTAKSGRRFFSGLKAFQKWGDIDAAFKGWAKNFRARLDKAHAPISGREIVEAPAQ